MKIKSCGQAVSCDLVIEHPSVSAVHARVELTDAGLVCLHDADSGTGTFLHRNESWIRIKKITLCIGDRIRLGEVELPLPQLTAVFGSAANTRLGDKPPTLHHGVNGAKSLVGQTTSGSTLEKPRRNPATGKIEEK